MKTKILFLLLTLALAGGAQAAADGFDAATSGNAFGLDLYQALRKDGENLFFSPASVAYALSMARTGAAGRTAAEMDRVLHLPGDADAVSRGFGELMRGLSGREHVVLELANRLYGDKSFVFRRAFLDRLERNYGAGFEAVDFVHDSEGARRGINGWVSDKTREKIPELLDPGAVKPSTVLVLINAVYFFGSWEHAFPEAATADAPFHTETSGDVTVPFMHQTRMLRYAEIDGAQVLALPYRGHELDMVLVLPAAGSPLADLEAGLDETTFSRWLSEPVRRNVKVSLPRLHLETQFEMSDVLAAMGMPTAFGNGADFTGMAPEGRRLFISGVVHKAYLDVDEKGTEAAAATGVIFEKSSAMIPEPAIAFTADRPFLLAIRDRLSGAVLFMGRVADPS